MTVNAERFWAKVDRTGTGCWLWTGHRGSRGYGTYAFAKGKVGRAHRIAYALTNGPIPDGLSVCHSCDVPACCNPAHLWLGTDADNAADRARKGRTVHPFGPDYQGRRPQGETHGSAKLTETTAQEILNSPARNVEMARKYGVSETCVSRLRAGITWPHLKATNPKGQPNV